MANPVNDMYADAVLAVILQVESNPTAAQGDYFIAFALAFILHTFKTCDVCCML